MVVEVGEIAFFAFGPSGPGRAVVGSYTLAGRDEDVMFAAPGDSLGSGVFIGKPGVVRGGLSQHGLESAFDEPGRFGGSFGDDHGDFAFRERLVPVRFLEAREKEKIIAREKGAPG